MRPSIIRTAILASLGAIAMMVPAAGSPTISGSTDPHPQSAATQQYAQDRHSRPVDYGYKSTKSKKCKKSDKKCKTKTKTDTKSDKKD